jgi:hypothetical protein
MKTETVDGLHVGYERRWYRHKCFTWLWYIEAGSNRWQAYEGDPWPSNRIPRKELKRAIADIQALKTNREIPTRT